MWISIDEGPDKGKSGQLKEERFTLGRAEDNTFVMTDDEISSHHLEITQSGGAYTLTDLNSTNGTFLAGARVEGSIPLRGDEVLTIGQSKMSVSLRSPDATVIHRDKPDLTKPGGPVVSATPDAAPAEPATPPPAPVVPATPDPAPVGEVSRIVRGTVEEPPRVAAAAAAPAPAPAAPSSPGHSKVLIGAVSGVLALIVIGVVLVLVLSGGGGKKKLKPLTAQQVIKQASPSVVRIQGDQGAGSGIVINARKGLILTNAHVVVGNSALTAQIGNNTNKTSPVQIVAADPCDDLAVLRLATPVQGLKALQFGNANALAPGSNVTVLGFPGSLQQSLSNDETTGQATTVVANTGTVSQVGVKADPDPSLPTYQDTIVHQAPVNHGDSGGPLLNQYGQVVGINTLTDTENQGQYYAISAAYIKRLLPGLIAGNSRGLVGWDLVSITPDDPDLEAELYDLYKALPSYQDDAQLDAEEVADYITKHNVKGMFDVGDQPGSDAAKASVQGDLITSMNGDPTPTLTSVCNIVSSLSAGNQVKASGVQLVPNNPDNLGYAANVNVTISNH